MENCSTEGKTEKILSYFRQMKKKKELETFFSIFLKKKNFFFYFKQENNFKSTYHLKFHNQISLVNWQI